MFKLGCRQAHAFARHGFRHAIHLNKMLAGRTTATQPSTGALPLPIRFPAAS